MKKRDREVFGMLIGAVDATLLTGELRPWFAGYYGCDEEEAERHVRKALDDAKKALWPRVYAVSSAQAEGRADDTTSHDSTQDIR